MAVPWHARQSDALQDRRADITSNPGPDRVEPWLGLTRICLMITRIVLKEAPNPRDHLPCGGQEGSR